VKKKTYERKRKKITQFSATERREIKRFARGRQPIGQVEGEIDDSQGTLDGEKETELRETPPREEEIL